jgi:D-sedoheptulose 7-phosphate isomerase
MISKSLNPVIAGAELYLKQINSILSLMPVKEISIMAEIINQARLDGNQIYTMGNGGSALTASHLVCDMNKGVSYGRDKRFRIICLNDNIATLLAYANDISYSEVFVEPLKNFLKPRDVVIGISGSGNSVNVLNAIQYATNEGAKTIAIVGYDGGKLKNVAQLVVHVPIDDMQVVEDMHMVICHMLMRLFCTVPDLMA